MPPTLSLPADPERAVMDALEGLEVWVGFRDEAGDDDGAYGTLDRDERRTVTRAVLAALGIAS